MPGLGMVESGPAGESVTVREREKEEKKIQLSDPQWNTKARGDELMAKVDSLLNK